MRKLYSVLIALLLSATLFAQAPSSFNYQAVVRNAAGNIIANTQVGMRISIIQGSISDTAVCQEEFTPTTNDFGLVTLTIGSVNTPDFAAIDWSTGPYFVKIELDPTGGTNYTEMGTSQLISVPYALYAKTAENSNELKAQVLDLIASLIKVQDFDGNNYYSVVIGTQVWMKENLKTTHYADGTAIPLVTSNNWDTLDYTDKAYCWYDDDIATNANTYGALYTWAAAMNGAASSSSSPSGIQGVCPAGWHLPSDDEWTTLTDYLGGTDVAGGKLKDTIYWQSPNEGATNESGFTALPGGYRHHNGASNYIGYYGHWWSSTEYSTDIAWFRYLDYGYSGVGSYSNLGQYGFSVRCLRD